MADLPPEQPVSMTQLNYCVNSAVKTHEGVTPLMLKTIIAVEGGQIGTIRKNTDRSLDLGPMQINTIHLKDIARDLGYSARDVLADPCKNINVGAWLLARHLKNGKGNYWLAMGNYHSKTASVRAVYLRKAANAYQRLIAGIRGGKEAEAIGRTVNWGRAARQEAFGVPSLAQLEAIVEGGTAPNTPWIKVPSSAAQAKEFSQPQVVEISNRRKSLRFIDNE
jgi:hypothetical protein